MITERFSDATYETSLSGQTAARTFDVDGVNSAADAIAAVLEVVKINDDHPKQDGLKCYTVRIAAVLGPFYFRVAAVFGVPPAGVWTITNDAADNFSLPSQIEFSSTILSRAIDVDLNGVPLINSAGDPFPPQEAPIVRRMVTIWRWEPYYNLQVAADYENTVNSDRLLLGPLEFEAGQVLCHCITPDSAFTTDAQRLRIRYSFELDNSVSNPFQLRVVDKGTNGWYQGADTNFYKGQIANLGGDPVTTDELLDGFGAIVRTDARVLDASGSPKVPWPNPDAPTYFDTEFPSPAVVLVFKIREEQPFMQLGL